MNNRNNKNNVKIVLYEKNEECCGCTACYAICPSKAIIMQTDREGFDYPTVRCLKEKPDHIGFQFLLMKGTDTMSHMFMLKGKMGVPDLSVYVHQSRLRDVALGSKK